MSRMGGDMKTKYYKRQVEITPKQEMHLQVDHYLDPVPEITEEEIDEIFPLEAERFMFKASDSYNKAQKHRREGAKAIIKLREDKR